MIVLRLFVVQHRCSYIFILTASILFFNRPLLSTKKIPAADTLSRRFVII